MSNLVSALKGASATGFAKVEEVGLSGMITLRGDLASAKMASAVKAATGAEMPEIRKINFAEKGSVAWMSPDELLILVQYDATEEAMRALAAELEGEHHLAVVVSDARAHFRVSEGNGREVLGKVMPVDFAPDAFAAGDFRRSRLSQVAAAVWMTQDGALEIVCFRSVAQYVFDVLKTTSQRGTEIGVY